MFVNGDPNLHISKNAQGCQSGIIGFLISTPQRYRNCKTNSWTLLQTFLAYCRTNTIDRIRGKSNSDRKNVGKGKSTLACTSVETNEQFITFRMVTRIKPCLGIIIVLTFFAEEFQDAQGYVIPPPRVSEEDEGKASLLQNIIPTYTNFTHKYKYGHVNVDTAQG